MKRPLALLLTLLIFIPLAGCSGDYSAGAISNAPEVARQQLAERQQLAAQGQTKLDQMDAVVQELKNKLDQVINERDTARARANELLGQLDAARLAGELSEGQLAELEAAAAQARAQAEQSAASELIGRIRSTLDHWTRGRDQLRAQLDTYLVSLERQKAELEAGTGGLGIGVNLQLAGEQIQRGAQAAPQPVRGYGELIGWGLAAVGGMLTAGQARKHAKAKKDRDHEAQMLNATISSIEAAKSTSTIGDSVDFSKPETRNVIDAVQNAVPGLKQRIDQVTSKA